MSLMIKSVFTYVDLFFGYLTSALMRVILYGLTAIFTLAAMLFVLVMPFDANFDLDELDTIELLVLTLFILVSARFFKRSKLEGFALWTRIKSYCFISTFLSLSTLALGCLVLLTILYSENVLGVNDIALSFELMYLIFSIIYILTLYSFTPLPKISWLSKSEGEQTLVFDSEVFKDQGTGSIDDDVFFTDSTGSTYTGYTQADNKQ